MRSSRAGGHAIPGTSFHPAGSEPKLQRKRAFGGLLPPIPQAQGYHVIPDGQGSVLAPYGFASVQNFVSTPSYHQRVTHFASGTVQADFQLALQPTSNPTDFPMVLGENSTAFATDGQTVDAFAASSGQSLWSYGASSGSSMALATPGGGLIVNDAQAGLVSLDPNGNPTNFSGTLNLEATAWSLGNWVGSMSSLGDALAEFSGPSTISALSPWPEPAGNGQKQNAPPKPTVVHFAPASTSDLGIASYDAFTSGMIDTVSKSKANHEFIYTGEKATPEYFLTTLAKPVAAVGFVGHSFDIDATPTFSVGLRFSTTSSALVRPSTPTDNPTYVINATNTRLVSKSQIDTQAKVVFIAACFTGPAFTSLWNIQSGTVGQALIVLKNPSATVLLGHGLVAWERILDDLVNKHMTVAAAVQEADSYLPSINVQEQYTYIGDANVKLVP